MRRQNVAVCLMLGLISGGFLGILGPLVLIATGYGIKAGLWLFLWCSIPALVGAVNGMIGAADGMRSDKRQIWPVLIIPLLPLALPIIEFVQYPRISKFWVGALLVVGYFDLFVWVAGRVGQEIGVLVRRRHDKKSIS